MPNDNSSRQLAKLRVKLGAHEFEAEGPLAVVETHFQTWQSLIANYPLTMPHDATIPAKRASVGAELFAVDAQRHLVTLRYYPSGKAAHADAALLLLYGFHQAFGETAHAVEVTRLKAALSASGHPGARINRTLERFVDAGLVKKHGRRKGSTFQLMPSGFQRATALAQALCAAIAPRT